MPGVEGLEQVGRLGAAYLADDDVIGPVAQAWRTRSRIVTSRPASPRASNRTQLARRSRSSSVSSIEMTRPSAGRSDTSAFSSVVFPEPVPPEISTLRSFASTAAACSTTRTGSEPLAVNSSTVNARPPKRRMVIAAFGAAGGLQMATRDPSASRASMMGSASGSLRSGRAIWTAARATASAVSAGASSAVMRPARSTKTVPGSLIITSDTASSSSASSSPGRNGLRSAMVSSIYSSPASRARQ